MTAILRSLIFNPLFFALTALALILWLPLLLLPADALRWAARHWTGLMFALMRGLLGLTFEVRGRGDLLEGPALIAAKHQSAWDTFVFFVLTRRPAYVMKRELMWIPVYGWLSRKQGHIAVDRGAGASAMRRLIRDARAALDRGHSIVLFPQGTRAAPGTPASAAPYQPGIAALYTQLGVPVVPVALNSGLFWGKRSFVKRPGTITVEVLDPIPPGLPRLEFMRTLEDRIEAATARLEGEARPAHSGL